MKKKRKHKETKKNKEKICEYAKVGFWKLNEFLRLFV